MKKDFYYELPDGYRADKTVDAKNKKIGILMNIAAIIIMIVVYILTDFIACGRLTVTDVFRDLSEDEDFAGWYLGSVLLPLIIFLAASFVYLVLHELTHGVAYKLLTGEKLTFGITWSAAYCGVPNLYVGKRTALIALLSPFILFSAIFICAITFTGETMTGFLLKLLFAEHFGGCVGDLYDTFLLTFKYRKGCLMNDDGPKQVFYVYEENDLEKQAV